MPPIRLMNWNIQNYGPTKTSMDDIVWDIAALAVSQNVDVLIILEINTTDDVTAGAILLKLSQTMNHIAGGTFYNTAILSPNTGLEFYGFIVRDLTRVQPCVFTGPAGAVPVVGEGYVDIAVAQFTPILADPAVPTVVPYVFPLIVPDLLAYSHYNRPLGVPDWPGVRAPCLALFKIVGAAAATEYLPITTCHFAADADLASRQIKVMQHISAVNYLAPDVLTKFHGANLTLNIVGVGPQVINQCIVTGDFNVDYIDPTQFPAYAPLIAARAAGGLGMVTVNPTDATHMITLSEYSSRDYKTTKSLSTRLYDNFFLGGGIGLVACEVGILAEDIRIRALALDQSIQHYAELDQRGFSGHDQEYKPLVRDAYAQLTGDKSMGITIEAALIGARLISDHCPVYADLMIL